MGIPTLVVSNPPHREVDLDAAADVLQLDVYAARLKAVFPAPEIMEVADPEPAAAFAAALRATGLNVAVLPGASLARVPWPDPVSTLALDVSALQVTIRDEGISVPYDTEIVGVYCRPPDERSMRSTLDLGRAIASGHGPTIAEAIQRRSIIDLYFTYGASLRRVTVVPDLLKLDGARVVKDLGRRLKGLRLDDRLAGVRPRAPFVAGAATREGPERRRYSFGTQMLYGALAAIAPELRAAPQYEIGSRLAYALSPLAALAGPG